MADKEIRNKASGAMKICRLYLKSVRSQSSLIRAKPSPSMSEMVAELERLLELTDKTGSKHHRIVRCRDALAERSLIDQDKAIKAPKRKAIDDFTLKPRGKKTKEQIFAAWVQTDAFLKSYEWSELRYKAFTIYGRVCLCCGSTRDICIDHIKPRRRYPELALDIGNVQPLCRLCNRGKGNWDETDWRPKVAPTVAEMVVDDAEWRDKNGMPDLDLAYQHVMGSA